MTQQFNGRRPVRKIGEKRPTNNIALTELADELPVESENGAEDARLTPAQIRQQLATQTEQPRLVSYRGFDMRKGNVREDELLLEPDKLRPNPFEDRMRGPIEMQRAEETIEALAREMRRSGFEGSLRARLHPDNPNLYQLVYGHLRVEAAKRAGIKFIKVVVEKDLSDHEMLWRMFNENNLRDDPGPVGDGETLLAIQKAEGLSIRELEERSGKNKGWVESRLKIASMPERAKEIVRHNPKAFSTVLELRDLPQAKQAQFFKMLEEGEKPAVVGRLLKQAQPQTSQVESTDTAQDYDTAFEAAETTLTTTENSPSEKATKQPKAAVMLLPEQESNTLKQFSQTARQVEKLLKLGPSPDFLDQIEAETSRLVRALAKAKSKR